MRQDIDAAQEVDAHPSGNQQSGQMIETFWPARRAAR
jgi:hypothetical protein